MPKDKAKRTASDHKYYMEHREERSEYNKKYHARNKDKAKQWRLNNADRVREQKRRSYAKHRDQILEEKRIYYAEHGHPKGRKDQKEYLLKKKYGITMSQYDEMLERQSGKCAICERPPPSNTRLAVDHNHQSGEIRGLLCGRCNRFVGQLETINGQAAVRYLEAQTWKDL